MAAPVASYVRLPDDASNTGKKVRTQTRLVGADTVHEHHFVPISRRSKTGVYHYASPLQSVQQTAQDGTTTGFFWLQNPASSIVDLAVRKLLVLHTGTVAANTSTRLLLVRFTFTGTPSGATLTPAKRKTTDAGNAGDMRTAVTGMTVTLGATVAALIIPALISAANPYPTVPQLWPADHDPFEEDDLVLAPGEGAVLYQADAGIASDSRRFTFNVRVEEVER